MYRILLTVVQIIVLFIFYFIGSWIQQKFHLSIPGSIIGMILLFTLLITKVIPSKWIEIGSSFLLSQLPLLFVPVTVGIMDYFSLFKGRGLFSLLIVVIGTVLVFVISGLVTQWTAQRSYGTTSVQIGEKGEEA